jgi:hypothetical protein
MLTGKSFRLTRDVMAIDVSDPTHKQSVTLRMGSTLRVRGEPLPSSRMVEVEWRGKPVVMFIVDLEERGERVSEASST